MTDMMLFYSDRDARLDDALNMLPAVRNNLVMFNEFTFTVNEVFSRINELSNLAVNSGIDVLMTPDTNYWTARERLKWGLLKDKCEKLSVALESGFVNDDYMPECAGFWFGKSGLVYAFPKSWKKHPVHKIPGTNTGVTICGEMHYINASDLEGVDLLLNPSREGDDVYLRGRTMMMTGLSFERVVGDSTDAQYFLGGSLDDYVEREKRFIELFYPSPRDNCEEECYKKAKAEVNSKALYSLECFKRDTTKGLLNPSIYVDKILVLLKQNPVPLVRCDNYNCTGVLFMPEDTVIKNLNYAKNHCSLSIGKV